MPAASCGASPSAASCARHPARRGLRPEPARRSDELTGDSRIGLGLAARDVDCGPVADIQRARLLAAAGQAMGERGVANVTVADIVECGGVSRRTFYELFVNCEECVLATLQAALTRTAEHVWPIWRSEAAWGDRVHSSLVALLSLFDQEPLLGRLLVVEALAAGPPALERRARVLETLVDAIDEGRREARSGMAPTRLSAEGVVGGLLAVLYSRITQPRAQRLVELAAPLASMALLPYCGAAAAHRELIVNVPSIERKARFEQAPLQADPFKAAGMRLTYRTMRVLGTIADHPSSSNRRVATLAGVTDQGQMSKLLSRLERLGLIVNRGEHAAGEANAWGLTKAGERVTSSIRAHMRDGQHTSGDRWSQPAKAEVAEREHEKERRVDA